MKLEPPAHLQPLLAAYIEVTGLAVSYTHGRAQALIDLHERGMTADDVRAVMKELKRRVDKGIKGYTPTSLTFRSAIEDVDRFEDRALTLRKGTRRRAPAPPDVPHTRTLPDGSTVSVLAPPAAPEISTAAAAGLEELRKCREKMRGGPP